MNRRERLRLELFSRVKSGDLSVREAARQMDLGERQARRMWKRYREGSSAGLVHGLRGRRSNRAGSAAVREVVLARYRERYAGFGPTLASEHLTEEGHGVSPVTLRRWLLAAGLWARCRKSQKHRSRRERRGCRGELVQMDGSTHRWFEGRCPACVAFVMIDDATGQTYVRFYATEDTAAAFDLFGGYARKHGLPTALYVDHDSIYVVNNREPTVAEALAGSAPLTQFGRAMKQLGVEIIAANSPQAKGRVERMNGTLQDRLVKELRLARIGSIAAANVFLETFLPRLNRKFTVKARDVSDGHHRIPAGVVLSEVLCIRELRKVGRDWCVRYGGRVLQLAAKHQSLGLAGREVEVVEKADGTLLVLAGTRRLKWTELAASPRPAVTGSGPSLARSAPAPVPAAPPPPPARTLPTTAQG